MHSLTVYSNVYMTSQSFVSSCSMLVLLRGIHWKGGQDSLRKEGGKKKKKERKGWALGACLLHSGQEFTKFFKELLHPLHFFQTVVNKFHLL